MSIPIRVVAKWKDAVEIADILDVGDEIDTGYHFRGQEDASWRLQPSLLRAVTNDGASPLPDMKELLKIEKHLFSHFRKVALDHVSAATLKTTEAEFDWWTIMRHYGVPTRLLDWTRSFYVALYFAVCRLPKSDGAIYCLLPAALNKAMDQLHGKLAHLKHAEMNEQVLREDAPPVVQIIGRKTALPDRMIAQQGVFMVCHNVAADIEAILTAEVPRVVEADRTAFCKVIVQANQKPLFMKKLRAMNVTGSSLFPGLDGIGRYLDELTRHRYALRATTA